MDFEELNDHVPLGLTHVVKVCCPDLLDEIILVAQYAAGDPIKSKDLERGQEDRWQVALYRHLREIRVAFHIHKRASGMRKAKRPGGVRGVSL